MATKKSVGFEDNAEVGSNSCTDNNDCDTGEACIDNFCRSYKISKSRIKELEKLTEDELREAIEGFRGMHRLFDVSEVKSFIEETMDGDVDYTTLKKEDLIRGLSYLYDGVIKEILNAAVRIESEKKIEPIKREIQKLKEEIGTLDEKRQSLTKKIDKWFSKHVADKTSKGRPAPKGIAPCTGLYGYGIEEEYKPPTGEKIKVCLNEQIPSDIKKKMKEIKKNKKDKAKIQKKIYELDQQIKMEEGRLRRGGKRRSRRKTKRGGKRRSRRKTKRRVTKRK